MEAIFYFSLFYYIGNWSILEFLGGWLYCLNEFDRYIEWTANLHLVDLYGNLEYIQKMPVQLHEKIWSRYLYNFENLIYLILKLL